MSRTFFDLVHAHYGFLERQHGFRLRREEGGRPGYVTDGWVEYSNGATVIAIDSDLRAASVWFYRLPHGRDFYLTPVAIDEYLRTSPQEKALLLSNDPADAQAASALFNRIFLLNQPGWLEQRHNTFDNLENLLKNYAGWLQEHADLCLAADFPRWLEFYEYKVQRARAEHLRRGEDEMVRAMVKDRDGDLQMVKRPIFSDEFDHIEKLKKELHG